MLNCLRILLIATIIILQGCGSDSSNLELIEQAKNLLNKRDYAGAIFLLEDISEKTEDVVVLTAEAYAGRGGFEIIPVSKNLVENKSSNELDLILNLSSSATSFEKSSIKKALELIEPIIATTSGKTELKYALFHFFYSSIILRNNYREDSCKKVPVSELNELLVSLTKGITSFDSAVKKAKITKLDSIAKNLLELREAINPYEIDYLKSNLNEEEEVALRLFLEESFLGEEKCE